MVDVEVLKTHIRYSAWASARLVEAAGALSQEELDRDFGTADKSVLGTLTHVFGADRLWLKRLRGETSRFLSPEDYRMEALRTEWPAVMRGWEEWVSGLTNAAVNNIASYHDMAGNPHRTPLWQIVLHVVNHGTHHRGQAAGFLRAMGHKPPALDLIAYYRSLAG